MNLNFNFEILFPRFARNSEIGKLAVVSQTSNADACGLHPDRLCRVGTSNLKP